MADKLYVWSPITTDRDEHGQNPTVVKVGEEITQDKLGVGDDEWAYLLETGVVRDQPYPNLPPGVSPQEYFVHEANRVAEVNRAKEIQLMAEQEAAAAEETDPAKAPSGTSSKGR